MVSCTNATQTPSTGCSSESLKDSNVAEEIKRGQVLPISASVEISGQTIELEVAQTENEQAINTSYYFDQVVHEDTER